jgi:hypothetical protein
VSLALPAVLPRPASLLLGAKLDRYYTAAAGTLDPRPRSVLPAIVQRERRMLAVAEYLRGRHLVDSLWTWTARESERYQHTAQYGRAMADLRRVRRAFAAENPGYALVADTNARSLRAQVRLWNRERSVAAAAGELHDSSRAWLADSSYPDLPDPAAIARFVARLAAYRSARPPTVAVPGLSLHGRLRAVDFAILHRGRVVAGTTSAAIDSVWERGGWSRRLRHAVTQGGGDLVGPLVSPREPWHYELTSREELR